MSKQKGFLERFVKKKSQEKKFKKTSEDDFDWARKIIDSAITPKLEAIVDELNQVLSDKNIRAGIEVIWRFDKEDQEDEN